MWDVVFHHVGSFSVSANDDVNVVLQDGTGPTYVSVDLDHGLNGIGNSDALALLGDFVVERAERDGFVGFRHGEVRSLFVLDVLLASFENQL